MRKVTLVLCAAVIVVFGSQSARAQDFCIESTLQGGGSSNFSASFMNVVGSTATITVIDTSSVNAIGFGALNVNNAFLAPVTLAWTVIADGTTESYDCRLFLPSLSGVGNLLTIRNTGNTRVQLSP
ncbi:MAG: hypothetical protein ACRD21_26590, partial [Vicinamibacteria bacterium]